MRKNTHSENERKKKKGWAKNTYYSASHWPNIESITIGNAQIYSDSKIKFSAHFLVVTAVVVVVVCSCFDV